MFMTTVFITTKTRPFQISMMAGGVGNGGVPMKLTPLSNQNGYAVCKDESSYDAARRVSDELDSVKELESKGYMTTFK